MYIDICIDVYIYTFHGVPSSFDSDWALHPKRTHVRLWAPHGGEE